MPYYEVYILCTPVSFYLYFYFSFSGDRTEDERRAFRSGGSRVRMGVDGSHSSPGQHEPAGSGGQVWPA